MDGETALWRAVVHRVLEDGCGRFGMSMKESLAVLEQGRARVWFNPRSRDFCMVCTYAGLDPECTAKRAHTVFAEHDAKQAKPEKVRRRG